MQITDEKVEAAAAAMYSRYIAGAVGDRIARIYVRRWRELDEEHKKPWRKCVQEALKAARANAPQVLRDILGGDQNADNTRDD